MMASATTIGSFPLGRQPAGSRCSMSRPVHRQDRNYFAAINDEMDVDGDAAGIAAMLYDLRRFPLDINLVRTAPETAGLHAQRIASMRGPAKWLFDVLTRGYIGTYPGDTWRETYSTEELFELLSVMGDRDEGELPRRPARARQVPGEHVPTVSSAQWGRRTPTLLSVRYTDPGSTGFCREAGHRRRLAGG